MKKIQHPLIIKTLWKVGTEGTYITIIKTMYNKPSANITLKGKTLKPFPLKSGKKRSVPTLNTAIQYSFGSPNHSNQKRKRNKRNPNQKIRRKLSLLADYMILYIENPKDVIRKLLELIVNLQDIKLRYRNALHYYILTMKKQKEKFRK